MSAYYSTEAEQAVLGGIMRDNDRIDDVMDVLTPEDWHRADHRLIWGAMVHLSENQKPLDPVTLAEYLDSQGQLAQAGDMAYLGMLVSNTPSSRHVSHYAAIVTEKSKERRLAKAGTEINELSAQTMTPIDERIDAAGELMSSLFEAKKGQGPRRVSEALPGHVDAMEERVESGGRIDCPVGFRDVDDMINGLDDGDLYIIAGRPSMGKTAFAMNIAETVALADKPALVFSMEMPEAQLIDRMIASLGTIPMGRIKSGLLTEDEWGKYSKATMDLNGMPLWIDDEGGLSPQEIRARARRQKRKTGVSLIVIDYLQLMKVPGYKGDNRTQEISEISRSLKSLAKELNCPVIALSQLNRSLEQRPNKRPVMSDLRESGAIEQDADVIVFIYRDEVYNEDSPDKGTAEIIIGKQRNGPTGTVRLTFAGEYSRFESIGW